MAVNGYLTKRAGFNQALLDIGIQCGKQQIMDYMTIALRDPNVVGNDIFGRERILKVFAAIEALDKEFVDAYALEAESDYLQEKLDQKLREVYGDELVPFHVRQPHIKQPGYQKARKGWK